ncbi:glycosyltransferase [bacterium]|nr:glycosyltransferase [bacterium]
MTTYSIVIPAYNEHEVIQSLCARLKSVLSDIDGAAEVIFVNDGSSDQTSRILDEIVDSDPRFRVVELSRNFGQQIAICAGLDHASGDAVIILDADLQDPPELIPQLIEAWQQGAEIVHAVRQEREGESILKRFCAWVYYRLLNQLSELPITSDAGDFRLISRKVLLTIKAMNEHDPFLRGLFSWVGYRQTIVEFNRNGRYAGRSKYTVRKLLRLASSGIFGFSFAPLKVIGFGGGLVFVSGLAIMPFHALPGIVLSSAGLQLCAIGVVGMYLRRILDEVRDRPRYVVAAKKGFPL